MRPSPFQLAFRIISVLVIAASAQSTHAKTIWETDDEFVRVVSSDSKRANSHPLKIKADTLLDILLKLEVVDKDKQVADRSRRSNESESASTAPLFSEITAERLAELMATAFRQTAPDQDILFQVKDSVSLIGVVGKPILTTGRAFWRDKKLHIIFGDIHRGLRKKYLFGQETELRNPPVLPERSRPIYPGEVIAQATVPNSGIAFAKVSGNGKTGYRRDWVIISPESFLMTRESSSEKMVQRGSGSRGPGPAGTRVADDMLQDPMHQLTKARLKRLKDLHERDLITEEMYRRRVERILEADLERE